MLVGLLLSLVLLVVGVCMVAIGHALSMVGSYVAGYIVLGLGIALVIPMAIFVKRARASDRLTERTMNLHYATIKAREEAEEAERRRVREAAAAAKAAEVPEEIEMREMREAANKPKIALGLVVADETGLNAVRVCSVRKGRAADMAGLAEGDVIRACNGVVTHRKRDFVAEVGKVWPGELITLEVLQPTGKIVTIKVGAVAADTQSTLTDDVAAALVKPSDVVVHVASAAAAASS